MSRELSQLRERYASFVAERDWEQFHTPQNIAMALSVEANELLECFLWHDNLDPGKVAEDDDLMADIEEEVADIFIYLLAIAIRLDIDLLDVVEQKLEANKERFDEDRSTEIIQELERWQRD